MCAYGGSPKSMQIRRIQTGIEVLIATPGRLNDLLEMKVVNLSQVVFLVLDEADRMYCNCSCSSLDIVTILIRPCCVSG